MKKKSLFLIPICTLFSFCTTKTKEAKFWEWFAKNSETYYDQIEGSDSKEVLFDKLNTKLAMVSNGLTWEFSPLLENGTRELTISADGIKEFFPDVKKLVEAAPEIPNWKINAFRQRVPGNDLKINFGEFTLSYSDIFFKSSDEDEKIGLELYLRDFNGEEEKLSATYILLDALIGEYDTETIIGSMDWKKLDDSMIEELSQFHKIQEIVDQKKKEIQ